MSFLKAFIGEYLSNHVVCYIPSIWLRYFFYKKILSIDIDKSAFIQMGCYIYKSKAPMHIGYNTTINRKCILDRRGELWIGNNVNISAEAALYTAGHEINSPDFEYFTKKVIIEDYVWIGTRAMVMPGVTVKRGAVILPGAIVTKDIEAYQIVGGIPAKVLDMRKEDLQYQLTWRESFY